MTERRESGDKNTEGRYDRVRRMVWKRYRQEPIPTVRRKEELGKALRCRIQMSSTEAALKRGSSIMIWIPTGGDMD